MSAYGRPCLLPPASPPTSACFAPPPSCRPCLSQLSIYHLHRPRSLLHSLPRLVCCTAEVRQMRRQGDDDTSVALLALGRQRAEVLPDGRNQAQSQVNWAERGWGICRGLSSFVPFCTLLLLSVHTSTTPFICAHHAPTHLYHALLPPPTLTSSPQTHLTFPPNQQRCLPMCASCQRVAPLVSLC